MPHPQDYNVSRVTSRRVEDNASLPNLTVPTVSTDPGLFKNELVVNSYVENPAIYLRVGTGDKELETDKLIRLGKVIVTDDLTSATEPTVLFDSSLITWTGEGWFRTTDNAYFVHDGTEFVRITPITATTTVKGLVELATNQEVITGVNDTNAVTPASLQNWRTELDILSSRQDGNELYVDQTIGDDSLDNYGIDSYRPFLTIERALLEVARRSFIAGVDNDKYLASTIIVSPGDYTIDNRPGSTDYTTLARQDILTVAPSASTHISNVTAVTPLDNKRLELTVAGLLSIGIEVNQQIWNTSGATGIVASVSDTTVVLCRFRGNWEANDSIIYANYSVFNSPGGGVIVPRGLTLLSIDPRKTIIRPRYLGDYSAWEASISGCNCSYVGGAARLKLTGGCKVSGFTFADNLTLKQTHHLVTAIEFASLADLTDAAYGYYKKVYQVLGNTIDPAIVLTEYQMNQLENSIVSTASNNTSTDGDGFIRINTVAGTSPWVSCCSLLSRFGARALRVDGNLVAGLKSMVIDTYTCVSMQVDERAYTASPNSPGGVAYKPEWAHASFEALNDGYIQAVSSFSIASAVGYRVRDGGELSLTNCHVNFGETAFVAEGRSLTVLPQDTGFTSLSIIPPKPIGNTTQDIPLGAFKALDSTATKLYSYDELDETRISPFNLIGGETLYLTTPTRVIYTAQLVDTAPFFGNDPNGSYINVKATDNDIYAQTVIDDSLDSYFIYIQRTPDLRQQADRIYWLQIEGVDVAGKRPPQLNYIFQILSEDYTLDKTLFVAKTRSTNTEGDNLGAGIVQVALMSANSLNDTSNSLYPALNIDQPIENSQISKTYLAINSLLEALGVSALARTNLLVAGTSPISIVSGDPAVETTLSVEFYKPSTIVARGTSLEFIGYGNYNSALPKYQDAVFDVPTYFSKLKREEYGGRVYNTGMNQDGQLITGDKLLDLRTGDELSVSNPFADNNNQILKSLTVTSRLSMYPSSVLSLGGARVSIDANTDFAINIQSNFKTYSTQDKAGFVELATLAESEALTDLTRPVTPGTQPTATTSQKGLVQLAGDLLNTEYLKAATPGKIIEWVTNYVTSRLNTFLSSLSTSFVPIQGIIMWWGVPSTIPAGYALCNGQTVGGITTPNLSDKFIMSANYLGSNVGASKSAFPVVPYHTHTATWPFVTETYVTSVNSGAGGITGSGEVPIQHDPIDGPGEGPNTGNIDVYVTATGTTIADETLPPYYVLAYIMRVY